MNRNMDRKAPAERPTPRGNSSSRTSLPTSFTSYVPLRISSKSVDCSIKKEAWHFTGSLSPLSLAVTSVNCISSQIFLKSSWIVDFIVRVSGSAGGSAQVREQGEKRERERERRLEKTCT